MRCLVYHRPAEAAAQSLADAGFLRWAQEDDAEGCRLCVWVRSAAEDRLVRGLLGPPAGEVRSRLDRTALAGWRVRLATGIWLLGEGAPVPRGSRFTVVLPVGGGFGLGDHPSTVLAARLLLRQRPMGKSVLDLGCGTGVLTALALRLGARNAEGVDLDHDAVVHARRTLVLNGLIGRIWRSDLLRRVDGRYHLICANLVGDLLCELLAGGELLPHLRAGGRVLISGISVAKGAAVRRAARNAGWRIAGRAALPGWRAYLLER